jgi:hypothetical protein
MKCNCESSVCFHRGVSTCARQANPEKRLLYVGAVCDACYDACPREYRKPPGQSNHAVSGLRPAPITGSVGEGEGDGWVGWTTCDESYSYEPTIAFGRYLLFIGRGTTWGAMDDKSVCVMVVDLERGTNEQISSGLYVRSVDGFDVECEKIERKVPLTLSDLREAVVGLAARYEAPRLDWVRDAVTQLWMAMVEV